MKKTFLLLLLWTESVFAAEVTILRDDFGVPHIFAETEESAAYAAGYAQAEDRLEQLLINYRKAEGTLAEAFGGEENFRHDYIQRLFGHAEVSRRRYSELDPKVRACLEAFQAGIRLFMREHPDRVPAWAPELYPWQVVALGRYIIWGWPLGEISADLRRAGIEFGKPTYMGSNQWLVAPERTREGAVIALVDPHLSWYDHFRFYESRLYGGALEVSGMAILGTPFPALGHNRYLSIAMTTGGPDTSDVFEETLNPDNPRQYRQGNTWQDMTVRTETIEIREGENVRRVSVDLLSTRHGPVVAVQEGKAYTAAISYAEEVGLLEQVYRMLTSRSLDDMKAALGMLQLMGQNIMVGTVQGEIYYVRNGRVPVRPSGFDYSRPVPGSDPAAEWQGIHPFGDLIQLTNPPQGYMQNCNTAPSWLMKDSPLTRERYRERPYLYDEGDHLHQRAAMVLELLDSDDDVTLEDAMDIALSPRVYKAELWLRRLAAAGPPDRPDARLIYDRITGWDGRSEAGSFGALAFMYWKEALGQEIARLVDPAEGPEDALGEQRLREALVAAAEKMVSDFGTVNVRFGDVFRGGRSASRLDYPVAGGSLHEAGMATPRAIRFERREDHSRLGTSGQTSTQLIILTCPPRSFTYVPLGQSDDPRSPHWDDQARELFSPGTLKPAYFLDRETLLKHVTSEKVLSWNPESGP